jgi:hypothetical protein
MPAWAALILFVAVDALPAAVLVPRIIARARAAAVPAGRYCWVAVFSGVGVGMAMQGLTAQWLVSRMGNPQAVSYGLGMAMLLGNGLLGSALVAGGAYVHLRMRTTRDPDYDDQTGSLEADIRQPRDGDHVRPD